MGIFSISPDGFLSKVVFVIVTSLHFPCMTSLVLLHLLSMNTMGETKPHLPSKLDLNKRNRFKYICLFINQEY